LPLQSRRGKVRGAGAQPSPVDLVALEVHRGAGLVLDPYLVVTYIIGQLVLKLLIEPVQDLKKTIGMISYALIERGSVISNPGNSTKDVIG
jgi:hypothetical protein